MAYQPRRAIFFRVKPVQAARMESGAHGNRKGIWMKRLLGSTAALSLVLTSVQPFPLWAQDAPACDMATGENCSPEELAAIQAAAEEAARAQAEAEAQAQAEAEARAAEEAAAQAAAEEEARAAEEAAAQAAAEEEARAAEEAAAQAAAEEEARAAEEAAAQAAAEEEARAAEEAAAQAEAEAKAAEEAAQAEADAKAAEEAQAAEETAVEEAAPEEPAVEEAPAEAPAPDAAATEEQPAEDPAMTDEAATEEPAAEDPAAEEPAAEEPAAEEPAAEEPATEDPAATGEAATEEQPAAEAGTAEPATDEAATDATATGDAPAEDAAAEETAPPTLTLPEPAAEIVDPSAGLATAEPDPATAEDVTPVEAPPVTETEVESLSEILADPNAVQPDALEAAAAFAPAPAAEGEKPKLEDLPAPKDAKVVVETLTEKDARKSDQEFAAAPKALGDGKKSGLSDLEKAGLVVLGALVVGAIINEGRKDERRVVSNTGDRIVVLKPDGTYDVYKDDDATLRRPGSTVRTETYRDGSTRTVVERPDGTQIVTVRDASGRVLRRAQYDRLGREIVLIDDMWEEEPVVVSKLPKPRKDRVTISTSDDNAALKAALAAKEAKKAGRSFTLRQIREIPEVRALAATIDVENVTFDTGSAAIKAGEADNLAELGSLMQDLLDANPGEVFLIEGHTDATGNAAMNLALSDRRAESVSLALTEYFDIPPENMVVQGYGESELLIDTQKDERRNRRVVVRVITPLMKTAK